MRPEARSPGGGWVTAQERRDSIHTGATWGGEEIIPILELWNQRILQLKVSWDLQVAPPTLFHKNCTLEKVGDTTLPSLTAGEFRTSH